MSIYSEKLAQVQVLINCRYLIAPSEPMKMPPLINVGALYIDDIMSYNSLTTVCFWCNEIF